MNTDFQKPNMWPRILEDFGFKVGVDTSTHHALILLFEFEDGIQVFLRILINDDTSSDVVITNMTVLPESQRKRGYGKKAFEKFLAFARHFAVQEIRATQVGSHVQDFWVSLGFVRCQKFKQTSDFVYVPTG